MPICDTLQEIYINGFKIDAVLDLLKQISDLKMRKNVKPLIIHVFKCVIRVSSYKTNVNCEIRKVDENRFSPFLFSTIETYF